MLNIRNKSLFISITILEYHSTLGKQTLCTTSSSLHNSFSYVLSLEESCKGIKHVVKAFSHSLAVLELALHGV